MADFQELTLIHLVLRHAERFQTTEISWTILRVTDIVIHSHGAQRGQVTPAMVQRENIKQMI